MVPSVAGWWWAEWASNLAASPGLPWVTAIAYRARSSPMLNGQS